MGFNLAYNSGKQLLLLDFSMTDNAVSQALHSAPVVCSTLAERRSKSSDVTTKMGLIIGLIDISLRI